MTDDSCMMHYTHPAITKQIKAVAFPGLSAIGRCVNTRVG
jgi:hypothetical protein